MDPEKEESGQALWQTVVTVILVGVVLVLLNQAPRAEPRGWPTDRQVCSDKPIDRS